RLVQAVRCCWDRSRGFRDRAAQRPPCHVDRQRGARTNSCRKHRSPWARQTTPALPRQAAHRHSTATRSQTPAQSPWATNSARPTSHIHVIGTAAAFWRDPDDVLLRVLYIAGFTMHAVLRIDLEPWPGRLLNHFIYQRRTIALRRFIVFRQIDADGDARILQNQVNRLVFLVVGVGKKDRGWLVEGENSIRFRIGDW